MMLDTDTLTQRDLVLLATASGRSALAEQVASMSAEEFAAFLAEQGDDTDDEPDSFADNEAGHNPPHPGLVYDEQSHRYHKPDGGGSGGDGSDDDPASVVDHPDVKGKPGVLGRVKELAKAAQDRVNAFILKHEGAFNAVASVLGAAITTPDDIAKAPWLAGRFGANAAGDAGAGDAFGTATGVPGSVAAKVVASVLTKGLAKLGITFAEAAGDVGQAAQLLAGLANAALDGTGVTVNAGEVQAWLADRLAPQG